MTIAVDWTLSIKPNIQDCAPSVSGCQFVPIAEQRLIITLYILMNFPIHIATISMGLPIVHFQGGQVEFSEF